MTGGQWLRRRPERLLSAGLSAALAVVLLCGGCGYIGDPLPPLANIPEHIKDLSAVQHAGRILVNFTLPTQTTEGVAIRGPLRIDLRVGTAGTGGFSAEDWAAQAKPVTQGEVNAGVARYEFPAADWVGREITIAVRVIGRNGKESGWSNFVNLKVEPPPETPAPVTAQNTPKGVRLSWGGPPGTFRILRRAGDEKSFRQVAEVNQLEWTDPDSEFGRHYAYRVQRGVGQAVSEPSEIVEITPEDVFPPAEPKGLHASAAPASIELSWEPDTEPDLAGYRVYRSVDGGEFERIAEVSQVPAYSDQKVERGKTYRYAVTAVDRAGNESRRSSVVEATL
jgi:hypothetical protein